MQEWPSANALGSAGRPPNENTGVASQCWERCVKDSRPVTNHVGIGVPSKNRTLIPSHLTSCETTHHRSRALMTGRRFSYKFHYHENVCWGSSAAGLWELVGEIYPVRAASAAAHRRACTVGGDSGNTGRCAAIFLLGSPYHCGARYLSVCTSRSSEHGRLGRRASASTATLQGPVHRLLR